MRKVFRFLPLLLALLLCAYLYLRPEAASPAAAPAPSASPLALYRAERNALREDEINMLSALCALDDLEPAARQALADEALALSSRMEKELALEAALLALGLPDALCAVRAESVTLFLQSGALDEARARSLLSLARELTGMELENIVISAP